MPSNLHPYDPAALTADREASESFPRYYRAAVLVMYHGPTDRRDATWRATIRRGSDRPIAASVPAHHGPDAAAAAVLRKAGLEWRLLPAAGSLNGGSTYCYVAQLYHGEGVALAAGERAVLALEACREFEAASLGYPADDANPYGLALALARQATGTDQPQTLISGWRLPHGGTTVTLTDHLGRDAFTLPAASAAGALTAAAAAGWQLSAAMRQTVRGRGLAADPELIARASFARTGCPAIAAALQGVAS